MKWEGSRGQKGVGYTFFWGLFATVTLAASAWFIPLSDSSFRPVDWLKTVAVAFIGWWFGSLVAPCQR